jgi:hypothetical protein
VKLKTVTVYLDSSTHRWLTALAKANSKTDLNPGKVNAAQLLAQAAFCFADHAGRRHGSWEAEAGRAMLFASGYQQPIGALKQTKMAEREERERRKNAR